MPIYRYQSGSLLDEVTILKNESGGTRAYLHASAGADTSQLENIRKGLSALGWKTLPTMHEGKAVIEVRGFKKAEKAIDALSANGWVKGSPTVEALPGDERTAKEKLDSTTLRTAGISYIIGDTSYIYYTFKKFMHEKAEHNKSTNFWNRMDIAGGFGYILGSAALAFYGSRDQSQNTIQAASKKIENYLRKEGVAGVDGTALHQAAADPKAGFWGGIDHHIAKYPSETLNSIYVGVGGALSSAAIYRALKSHHVGNIKDRNIELIDVGLGAVTATSALAGLFIKEKRREEGEPKPQGIFANIWAWIEEKPLRATGIGYAVATGFHAVATFGKWRAGDKIVRDTAVFRAIFVGANVFSELFMALSSKGHGTGVKPDESIDQSVIACAADAVRHYPTEQRPQVIQQLSGYMASRDVLGGKADTIATQLSAAVEALNSNPWAGKVTARVEVPAALALVADKAPGTRIHEAQHHAPIADAAQAVAL